MKLKSLEISGFKSFADKTKIEFMPGMTGIVGPNGSGKSNIIEAIRWVMGEQSAKGLRGDKMQDVIFGGTSKRSPLNRAEVSIVFDNSDHYLKTDWSEIRLTRRLYRSGESNYQINGQDVRLRDILELFMDSGLGRESFSIISQGRVEAIFNSKPEDRRAIIEEVAGVYKYKTNKERAERELRQTQENLDRVQDIMAEIGSRVEPLARQSALAQDYLEQKAQYDRLEKSRLVIEIADNREAKQGVDARVQILQGVVQKHETAVNGQTSRLQTLKQERTALELERDELQQKLVQYAQAKERLQGLQNVNAERDQNRTATVQELTSQLEAVETNLTATIAELATKQTQLSEQAEAVETVNAEVTELTGQTVAERVAQLRKSLQQEQSRYVELLQRQASLSNEKQNLERNAQQSSQAQAGLSERLAAAQGRLQESATELADLEAQLATAKETQTLKTAQFDAVTEEYKQAKTAEQKVRQAWYDGLGLAKQAQARLESLQNMGNEYTGFYQGVRNLMKHKADFPGIEGVVAELIKVPADYNKAIETALGAALQQVVVDNEQTAKNAVRFLTQQRLGRVTFLPRNVIKARNLAANQVQAVTGLAGFVGVASDLVQVEAKYAPIVDNLLGTVVIADNLDNATAIARVGQHRFRIVTLDGQVINPGGSITGGAQRNDQNGLLSQKAEIDKLQTAVKTMEAELLTQERQVRELTNQLDTATEQGSQLREAVAQANEHVQVLTSQCKLASDSHEQLNRQVQALQYEQGHANDSASDYEKEVAQNLADTQQVAQDLLASQAKTTALEAEVGELSENQSAIAEQIQTKREWLAAKRATYDALASQVNQLKQRVGELEQQQGTLAERLELLTANDDDLYTASQNAKVELVKTTKAYERAQLQTSEVREKLSALNTTIANQEAEFTKLATLQRESLQEMNDLRAQQARLATLLDQAMNQLNENYALSVVEARAEVADLDLPVEQIRTQLKLIKRGLDEIGDVNLGVIEEYQEVKTRFDFLTSQQTDLVAARTNLYATMNEMDVEVQRRFKLTFDEIAAQFNNIFTKMFGGGQAELTLTDPEHLLTTGIDIMAQPPGKKFQQMSLLSGGEKALTAITLLFSILAVRPVPFAILDETEAALDDANVTRFAEYLHNFEDDTQFIVITHRKGTMVNADVLYGITMQESGVSKMVSVNLNELED